MGDAARRCRTVLFSLLFTGLLVGCGKVNSRKLLLAGGGDIPQEAIERFVEWSGNSEGRILIVTWGTSLPPAEPYEYMREVMIPAGAGEIVMAPSRQNFSKEKALFEKQLEKATAVFFTGGDQNYILDLLVDHPDIVDKIHLAYNNGIPFGGTSAGTAIMSALSLTGDGEYIEQQTGVRTGLGLLKNMIVDQHFIKRNRLPRLVGALKRSPFPLGLGVDEDGALAIENNEIATVVGNQRVIAIRNTPDCSSTEVFEMQPGQSLNLTTHQIVQ